MQKQILTYMNKDQLNTLITSPEYKLIFRYSAGSSWATPDSRIDVFEIYQPKDPLKFCIFKESRPGSWEEEPDYDEYSQYHPEYHKKVLSWRKDFKIGMIKQSEKLLSKIRELPTPNYLKDESVCDGDIFALEVNLSDFKAKYNWMYLVEGKDFEKMVKNIITFSKRNKL